MKFKKSYLLKLVGLAIASVYTSPQLLAFGPGRMLSTEALTNVSGELSGPTAFAVSLGMIAIGGIQLYRHHQEWGVIGNGAMGLLAVAGIALGAPSVLSMIPGAAGALI